MPVGARRSIAWLAACAVAVAATLSLAAPASGAPSVASISRSIASKQAEAASASAQLTTMQSQLTSALAQFDDVSLQLNAARNDLASTTSQLSTLDGEIAARSLILDDRAVAMYKTGNYDVLQALLSVSSFQELLTRVDMLAFIQKSDSDLLDGLATAREQAAFLQQQQSQREADLVVLRQQADARSAAVDAAVARQSALLKSLSSDVARLVKQRQAAQAAEIANVPGVPSNFQADTLVSDATFLDASSMSAAQVQAFLNAQAGPLKSYSGPDHSGATRTAAQMIADAAVAWHINPKVILVTLEKEQSLLSSSGTGQTALDWAMGCGKTDSGTLYQYQGFGNQIWGGAEILEENRSFWSPGISIDIDGKAVYPSNASTQSLYRYTPHFHGAVSFFKLFWRYFGDPLK